MLGDFFLVRHFSDGRVFKMLIDCGVLQCIGPASSKPSTSHGKVRILENVKDFIQETNGVVDLLVATHEHYDHLSGFILANAEFRNFKIGKVWMAWTEDPLDKLANTYRTKKNRALAALAALTQSPALAARDEMMAVANLLQFYGGADSLMADKPGSAKTSGSENLSGNASCAAALDWIKQRAGGSNVLYLKPGQLVRWGIDGVFSAHVLGPPRDDKLLRKLDPTRGDSEVYLTKEIGAVYLTRGEDVETIVGLANLRGEVSVERGFEDQPFTRPHWRQYPLKRGASRKAKKELRSDPVVSLYQSRGTFDRNIDDEWMGSAETLALKIDGDVNNTSLALALQVSSDQMLLFPGDAQVGNWLSWGNQEYPTDDRDGKDKLTIDRIFAQTIFYKVGHHASHNATLRERGLELMTNPKLAAMVPVVEETAREQVTKSAPRGWSMPYGKLYARLAEITKGRIVRGDGKTADEKSKFKASMFDLTYGPGEQTGDPLWAELSFVP